MTWERALEADARLAAKNALLIRAALRQTFDAERAYHGYLNTTPDETLNLAQQRVRARSWAIMNIRINLEALKEVVYRTWAQAYVLGDTAAREAIKDAELAQKADTKGVVDWSKWKPGDAASALILKPPRAFQRLLENQGIVWKGFSDTTLTDIGNAVGEAIYLGLDAKTSAKTIMNHVASPARALSIAITEQNRAISAATVDRYRQAGLQQMEWLVFQPCDKCKENANKKVPIGSPFPSGDTQPPAHPHCRCALAPVIPGFDDPAATGGVVTQPVTTPDGTITNEPFLPVQTSATWKEVTEDRWLERQAELKRGRNLPPLNDVQLMIAKDQYKRARMIYEKNAVTVYLDRNLTTVEPSHLQAFLQNFDEVYAKLPEWRKYNPDGSLKNYMLIIKQGVGGRKGNVLAYTYLGHDTIWFSGKDVISATAGIKETPSFAGYLPGGEKAYWHMAAAYEVNSNKYTIAHELGHTVDSRKNDAMRGRFVGSVRRKYKEGDLWSVYGTENSKEAYAEVFAQWLLGVETPVTKAFAERFGWELGLKDYWESMPENIQWAEHYRPSGDI